MIKKIVKCILCFATVIWLIVDGAAVGADAGQLEYWLNGSGLRVNDDVIVTAPIGDPELKQGEVEISSVRRIYIDEADRVNSLNFGEFTSLESITIIGCSSLESLSIPEYVRYIRLHGAISLREINGLENCADLRDLILEGCRALGNLAVPSGVRNVSLIGDISLREVEGLENCAGLRDLTIRRCSSLENLSIPRGIDKIHLIGNRNLKTVSGINGYRYLSVKEIFENEHLK